MSQHHEEEALDKSYDARLMRRLIQYLKPYQLQVLAAMVLIGVASLMQVSSPYLTKIAIDNYIIHKDQAGLNRIVLIYLGIVAFGFFLGYIQTYIMQLTGQRIMVDLRLQIFSHLQNLPLAWAGL
jgi:ATP-binding cassette subfamily B multidrug efflux pump